MAVVAEHAVGGARRRPCEGGARGRPYPGRVGAEQPEDLLGQLVPGCLARARRVVHARPGRRAGQRDDLFGDIDRPGRLPQLVGDDIDERLPARQVGHRPDEIGPVCPVQPGGPHHVAGLGQEPEHGLLPGQLGAPVGGARRGAVILRVGSKAIPAEHVVGGHVHQPGAAGRARGGDVLRAPPVDQEGLVLAGLGIVDGGPGCAVDDDSGTDAQDEGADGAVSVTSSSPRGRPVTSWPRRPRTSTRSRPSIPPAPVTSHPVMARRWRRPRWPATADRARGATA